jgi:hypothetical protein
MVLLCFIGLVLYCKLAKERLVDAPHSPHLQRETRVRICASPTPAPAPARPPFGAPPPPPPLAGFRAIADGPFSITVSEWPDAYSPVALELPPGGLRGVVLLFHGCNHVGADFFRLLEERAIVTALLNRSLAAVAFTSADSFTHCWSEIDLEPVSKSFKRLAFDRRLPVFAFGASSGGSFVTILPRAVPVDGVIVEISPGDPSAGDLAVPAAFIYMERDVNWASAAAVQRMREGLTRRSVPSAAFPVQPFNLTWGIFADRLPEFFDRQSSSLIFEALVAFKFVQSDGWLSADPRRSEIVDAVMRVVKTKEIVPAKQHDLVRENIAELFNAAWGFHEMTRDHVMEALSFLSGTVRKDVFGSIATNGTVN